MYFKCLGRKKSSGDLWNQGACFLVTHELPCIYVQPICRLPQNSCTIVENQDLSAMDSNALHLEAELHFCNTNSNNGNMKYGRGIYLQSHIANLQLDTLGQTGLGFIRTIPISSTVFYTCLSTFDQLRLTNGHSLGDEVFH